MGNYENTCILYSADRMLAWSLKFDHNYRKQENELFPVLVFETMTCLVNLRIKNQYGKSAGFL